MIAVYELLEVLPPNFVPSFAPRLNKLCVFLMKNPGLNSKSNEHWSIIQGYLYFLIKREKIKPYDNERFYLGKFLNEMPLYARDKAGHNINILIIQILTRMQREQYGHIIDRIDSLKEYARKYTRKPETKRANIFITMIIRMERAQFHRAGTETKTAKLVEKLEDTPLKIGQNLAIEVIPYEVLWREILSMLENKFRATTIRKTPVQKQIKSKDPNA